MATVTITGSEVTRLRSKVRETDIGPAFSRVYHVAPNKLSTLPVRGDLVTGFTQGASSDLLKPRVTSVKYVQQKPGAFQDAVISFIQPVILSGGSSTANWKETQNSRVKRPGQFQDEAVVLGVCSDDTHPDVPAKGDKFPGDESANLPRVCFSVTSDPNVIFGLSLITARYRGSIGV